MQLCNPKGLRESSRWSKRSEDHRLMQANDRTPTGCQMRRCAIDLLCDSRTPSGCHSFLICSGGFRFAATTGYCLSALRADAHSQLSDCCTSNLNSRMTMENGVYPLPSAPASCPCRLRSEEHLQHAFVPRSFHSMYPLGEGIFFADQAVNVDRAFLQKIERRLQSAAA